MRDDFDRSPIRVPPEVNMLPVGLAAHRVMTALFRYTNKSLTCTVGRDAIMLYLPNPDPRNMRRGMRELVTAGFLDVRHNTDGRTGALKRNTYVISLPSLKKLREMRRRDKCVPPCVKLTPPHVSNVSTPNVLQLKPRELKEKAGTPSGASTRRNSKAQILESPEDARTALDHFKTLYAKKAGQPMAEFPRHLWIMDSLVRAGSIGLPATMAVCDLWFMPGPWRPFAEQRSFALAHGMERCVEQIQGIPSYDERKRRYASAG